MKITLELCRGSNEGTAFYLCDTDGGKRVAGPKCWGFVKTIHAIEMSESDLQDLSDAALRYKEKLANEKVKAAAKKMIGAAK